MIGPDGTFVVEPVRGEAIIHATIDLDERDRRSSDLDVTGHYGRSDVFRLEVDDRPRDIVHRRSGSAD
ncbi:hypothetical protein GCM10025881_21380 [Pseudolysinimonas kribbensis]|uniref:CN hydrolase domain-containing protein n=1 Tax=Pseudolysinimonas kribbensis TaxID=433641 RepID=A0ABQ6K7Q8_9MICO|nr:hypothetical protein [Pseudolysinimonas kribbensis]GMA95314.1 hypothetical protein GCM10025881_21380 [Pseudolysinimonas kribbensis]